MVMIRKYPKGQILLFEGDPLKYLYKLTYGVVKIYSINDTGSEHILAARSAPDTFPLSILIGRTESEFFYEALTDIEVEFVDPADINVDDIMRQAIELFYGAMHRIAALEAPTVAERAIATLEYFRQHGIDRPTHQMIANAANATRESVSSSLKKAGKANNGKRKTR